MHPNFTSRPKGGKNSNAGVGPLTPHEATIQTPPIAAQSGRLAIAVQSSGRGDHAQHRVPRKTRPRPVAVVFHAGSISPT